MHGQPEISERQEDIADLVQSRGFASVEALAERFDVTAQTIRRDVNRLCERGVLRRTHGGVEPPAPAGNVHYRTRRILNLPEKRRIAGQAAARVPDGASIAFSIGTTLEIVMQALARRRNLRVFTNNLNVAFVASGIASFQVTIAGGCLRHGDRDVLGPAARDFFAGYKLDIGIFGVAGVEEDGTLLDFHEDEVAARQAIPDNCREAFLVLDRSKFGRGAHVRGGHITDVDRVFCDKAPPTRIPGLLTDVGRAVVICGEGGKT